MKNQLEWQKNLIQLAFKQIQDECHERCAALEGQLSTNRRNIQTIGDHIRRNADIGSKRPLLKPPTLSVDVDEMVAKRFKPSVS
jgi:hypothetical protein